MSTVCSEQCAVCSEQCPIHSEQCAGCSEQCTVHSKPDAVCSDMNTVCSEQSPVCSEKNPVFSGTWISQYVRLRDFCFTSTVRTVSYLLGYRHSSGRLYLPFGQSWPIFRRHVYLATAAMTSSAQMTESDQLTEEELELQKRLDIEQRCPFVTSDYWKVRRPASGEVNLFWCSIDLEKFYPSTKLDIIQKNIVEQLPPEFKLEASRLLASMLQFPLDKTGWSDKADLKSVGIKPLSKKFRHIPTGLYVSGFLANADLLGVDLEVKKLLQERNVAHFRYVDEGFHGWRSKAEDSHPS